MFIKVTSRFHQLIKLLSRMRANGSRRLIWQCMLAPTLLLFVMRIWPVEGADISVASRSFVIDYEKRQFLKDGQPFQMIGAAVHYYTIPAEYWEDRLKKVRAMGVNVIQVYIEWATHEPEQGRFNFNGMANITQFLTLINDLGMLISLRPSPYIDSERDMGGLPPWLLKYDGIHLRSSDTTYMQAVRNWYYTILPMMRPFLYTNGGPIISVQVENEYGSYGCDKAYMESLRDTMKMVLWNDVLLYTTDGAGAHFVECGSVTNVHPTVDFGVGEPNDINYRFEMQPLGPRVNSEFYTGWFDKWGNKNHAIQYAETGVASMESMWALGGSFTIYMAVGGTHFGYTAGAFGYGPDFSSATTSYDYDSPISEAGDPTPKFHAYRAAIEKHLGRQLPFPLPTASPKAAYGIVHVTRLGSVLDLLDVVSPPESVVHKWYPVNVEQIGWNYGFTLYSATATQNVSTITIYGVHDRAYVLISGSLAGMLQRPVANPTLRVDIKQGDRIDILVENQGRICYGQLIIDMKGLTGQVTLDEDSVVSDWKIYPIDLTKVAPYIRSNGLRPKNSESIRRSNTGYIPSIYAADINLPELADTFMNPAGWGKGQLVVNGIDLGRYWPGQGPQVTLYVPKPYLQERNTNVVLFELDAPGNCADATLENCKIEFGDKPLWTA